MAAVVAVLAVGCGKKGPPQAPVRIAPAPPGALMARQIGRDVVLSADLPGTRTNGTRLDDRAEVRVLRMPATESLRPGAVSDRYLVLQFEKQARPVASLAGESLAALVAGGRLLFVDHGATAAPIPNPSAAAATTTTTTTTTAAPATPPPSAPEPATQSPTTPVPAAPAPAGGLLYALQVVEPQGRRSPIRRPSLVQVCDPPDAPGEMGVDLAEGEVRLSWAAPVAGAPAVAPQARPADAAAPGARTASAVATGPVYNVYRRLRSAARDPETPLNPAPLDGTSYIDRAFEYDADYVYFVRVVAQGRSSLCESLSGPVIEVRPHDRYPPAAPAGLAVAAEGGVIRIYWFPNSEADLAGYRVYRRTGGGAEPVFLAEVPATETSYVDSGARPGVRYDYSVSAVDGASPPNESPRSEERSETLSPQAAGAAPAGGG